jgi:hypothetical protein
VLDEHTTLTPANIAQRSQKDDLLAFSAAALIQGLGSPPRSSPRYFLR